MVHALSISLVNFIGDGSFRITLKSTTLLFMRSSNRVLSFWATTDPATVNKLRVYRRAYEVSVLGIARFVFATATNWPILSRDH